MLFFNDQTGQNIIAETILQRIAKADKTAIQECLETYGNLVWSFARMKTDSSGEAEQLALKIFNDLWKCAGQFDPAKCNETHFITLLSHRSNRRIGAE